MLANTGVAIHCRGVGGDGTSKATCSFFGFNQRRSRWLLARSEGTLPCSRCQQAPRCSARARPVGSGVGRQDDEPGQPGQPDQRVASRAEEHHVGSESKSAKRRRPPTSFVRFRAARRSRCSASASPGRPAGRRSPRDWAPKPAARSAGICPTGCAPSASKPERSPEQEQARREHQRRDPAPPGFINYLRIRGAQVRGGHGAAVEQLSQLLRHSTRPSHAAGAPHGSCGGPPREAAILFRPRREPHGTRPARSAR